MQLGSNVHAEVKAGQLILTVSLDAPATLSATGKTMVLASTRGNQAVADGGGEPVYVGLNVYRKR